MLKINCSNITYWYYIDTYTALGLRFCKALRGRYLRACNIWRKRIPRSQLITGSFFFTEITFSRYRTQKIEIVSLCAAHVIILEWLTNGMRDSCFYWCMSVVLYPVNVLTTCGENICWSCTSMRIKASNRYCRLFHIVVRTGAYTCGHEPSEMNYKVRNLKGLIAL